MAKTVLYSPYYLEAIEREYDQRPVTVSRGGRLKGGTDDPQEMLRHRKEVISRARKNIKQYVMHNFMPRECYFITFTMSDDVPEVGDLQESVKRFRRFLKRLRRYLKSFDPNYIFKFVYVAEFHKKRDAVHFHMISDMPEFVVERLPILWGSGFVDSDIIEDPEDLLRSAIYLGKSLDDPRLGKQVHLYWKSRNIKPPRKVVDPVAVKVLCNLAEEAAELVNVSSYKTEYQGNTLHEEWFFHGISVEEHLERAIWI